MSVKDGLTRSVLRTSGPISSVLLQDGGGAVPGLGNLSIFASFVLTRCCCLALPWMLSLMGHVASLNSVYSLFYIRGMPSGLLLMGLFFYFSCCENKTQFSSSLQLYAKD